MSDIAPAIRPADVSGVQLDRLTGSGSFNGGQMNSVKANIPYPPNAPPIAPKF
jgi:hypothetical protein